MLDRLIADKPAHFGEPKPLSLYLTKIARLGGYLARTKDPPPGNIVTWRGLSRLTDITLGAAIGAELVGNESLTGRLRSIAAMWTLISKTSGASRTDKATHRPDWRH
ncbi:hypothetical protein [Shinella oryzae]|uniref:Transposase Tn5 dimerisation domain-containing protein n=1 Tax=Shinella oryzae TaxID=2871820 RepID=A0ABY9JYS3_9HYPH|nr:hypothetical protein [Shinella oryzae]WLS01477.1 hypothetical protein Q9315_08375 [Shinella oryzae]